MSWSDDDFFPAFEDEGMLTEVHYQPPAGDVVTFMAGFQQPDEILLDGMVHSTGYSIEYQSADIELKRNFLVLVGTVQYRVRQPPVAKGDGSYMTALLEKV